MDIDLYKEMQDNIIKCLTSDFKYISKRCNCPAVNLSIYNEKGEQRRYGGVNIDDLIEAISLGISLTLDGSTEV